MNFSRITSSLKYNLLKGWLGVFLFSCIIAPKVLAQNTKRDTLLQEIKEFRNSNVFDTRDTLYIHNLINLATEHRYHNLDSLLILSKQSLDLSKKSKYINGTEVKKQKKPNDTNIELKMSARASLLLSTVL